MCRTLWLSNNKLTSVPGSLGQLHKLRQFYIDNNAITELPEGLAALGDTLDKLYAHGNPLTHIPEPLNDVLVQQGAVPADIPRKH